MPKFSSMVCGERMNSIWYSLEANAWCRDFGYEDYIKFHSNQRIAAQPLSRDAYIGLCRAFEIDMEDKNVASSP